MVEVLQLAGPSVILLDELVMFARQLGGRAVRGVPVLHPVADRGG